MQAKMCEKDGDAVGDTAGRHKSMTLRQKREATGSLLIEMGGLLHNGEAAILSEPRLTPDELWTFCRDNADLRIERKATGELIVMAPADSFVGNLNSEIGYQLRRWYHANGKSGLVFDSSAGFTLPSGAVLSPDAAWMSKTLWDSIPENEKKPFAHACPEFVIELMSPSDRLTPARDKMEEWIENGALLGWLIDRKNRKVYVYRPGAAMTELDNPALVPADPELPGFALETEDIFRKDTHE